MTEKLFYEDPYKREFTAKVTEMTEVGVILDRTCFYPEGGGQEGDTGRLNGAQVKGTIEENGKVVHILESVSRFEPGKTVNGQIDWERRYKTMRIHSSAHIVDYFVTKYFGELPRIGSHISSTKGRLDYALEGRMDPEKLKGVEKSTNDFLSAGLPIETREDPEHPGLRYWKCGEIVLPCGGTHVQNTEEIGGLKLKRKNIGKGKERIEIYLAQ